MIGARKFGRTMLEVSELGLAVEPLHRAEDERTAFQLLDVYYAAGGRFLQVLADSTEQGSATRRSDDLVGRWRTTRGVARDTLILGVRIHLPAPQPGGSIANVNLVRRLVEESVARLRAGYLDLLVIRCHDNLPPVDDILEAADLLVKAGLIRYVVADSFPLWRVADSIHRSNVRHRSRFEGVASQLSLLTSARYAHELTSLCREHRVGLIVRSPLAGGVLARSMEHELRRRVWLDERFGDARIDATLGALQRVSDRHASTPAQISLAWCLRQPAVISVLVTASSVEQLEELLPAAAMAIPPEDAAELERAVMAGSLPHVLRHV